MTTERDIANQMAFAERKGQEQGISQEKQTIAQAMLAQGISVSVVSACTGLSEEEVELLRVE